MRLTDDVVGVSVDMPRGWYHEELRRPAIRFIRSYDQSLTSDALVVPVGGVGIRVEVLRDMGFADLEAFADRHVWVASCPSCRRIVEREQLAIDGQDVLFLSVWQSEPYPRSELEPTLYWLVRSPFLSDRVIVIRATPAASPLRAQVEEMVATIQFYKPAPPDLRPTRTRQQVIDSIRSNSGYTIMRIEAKLVLMTDWARTIQGVGPAGGPRKAHRLVADQPTPEARPSWHLRRRPGVGPLRCYRRERRTTGAARSSADPTVRGRPTSISSSTATPRHARVTQRRRAASSIVRISRCAAASSTSCVLQNVKRMRCLPSAGSE